MNSVRFSAAQVHFNTEYRDRSLNLDQAAQKRNWSDLNRIDALLKQDFYRGQLNKLDDSVQIRFYPHATHVQGGEMFSSRWVPTQLAEISVRRDAEMDSREKCPQVIRVERPFNKFPLFSMFDGRQFLTNFVNDVVTAAQVVDASIRGKNSSY